MIWKLRLVNFKAFTDSGTLELAPVTVLCGPNSSGKSSIIQSLLLLKQSVENPLPEEPLTLNGSFISLGEFTDVHCIYGRETNELAIEMSLIMPRLSGDGGGRRRSRGIPAAPYSASWRQAALPFYRYDWEGDLTINVKLTASSDPVDAGVRLSSVHFEWGQNGRSTRGPFARLELVQTEDRRAQIRSTYEVASEDLEGLFLVSKPSSDPDKPVAYRLHAFLPMVAYYPYWPAFESTLLQMLREIFEILKSGRDRSTESEDEWLLLQNVITSWRRLKKTDKEVDEERRRAVADELAKQVKEAASIGLPFPLELLTEAVLAAPREYFDRIAATVQRYEEALRTSRGRKPALRPMRWRAPLRTSGALGLSAEEVSEIVRVFFTRGLYYLGPLREEPRAFYRRAGSADPTYVGQRGENVAFVLKYYGRRPVRAVLPPVSREDSKSWNPTGRAPESVPLRDAVVRWLQYLGMAEDIRVEEMGKIGLAIRARVARMDPDADLTNVGVGLSQVLPLLVLGLMAPDDSTLLLEQPELHLHPFVQSRLADFFLSLTPLGKRIVAETHSEHVIHRLRLMVARGFVKPSDIRIYFTSRPTPDSSARIEEVAIGELGDLDHWPDGFFDETSKAADAILEAVLERSSREGQQA